MPKCFIITPYGKRTDAGGNIIDFDNIFEKLIREVVVESGFECIRSDKDIHVGPIFKKMIYDIATSDICIADISMLNPNVFYELGVRHALCRGGTVLICQKGYELPFDIKDLRVLIYGPPGTPEFNDTREKILNTLRHAHQQVDADSFVFYALPELSVTVETPKLIDGIRTKRYRIKNDPARCIGLMGGELAHVRDVSVWVNSENTDMQMSRYYEPTVSGTIRYFGAEKGPDGRVKADLIADDLKAWMRRHRCTSVVPGAVAKTVPGRLKDFGVKFVLHVAAVHATPGQGYNSVADLAGCVRNALRAVDDCREEFSSERASVLLPLLGTGSGGRKVEGVAADLFSAAINYLQTAPNSIIEKVWFLARSEQHWGACMQAFAKLMPRLGPCEEQK